MINSQRLPSKLMLRISSLSTCIWLKCLRIVEKKLVVLLQNQKRSLIYPSAAKAELRSSRICKRLAWILKLTERRNSWLILSTSSKKFRTRRKLLKRSSLTKTQLLRAAKWTNKFCNEKRGREESNKNTLKLNYKKRTKKQQLATQKSHSIFQITLKYKLKI